MTSTPLVTVIIPFYNTSPRFMEQAFESVMAQTYLNWELLLVDDGSTGDSSACAKSFVSRYPEKIFYLEHEEHANRGQSASRNLGISHARGEYIAFLDADDIWMPNKLSMQVKLLDNNPLVGLLYANTQYWYSWANAENNITQDFIPVLGVQADTIYQPPALLPLFLEGKAAVPCINSLLVRKQALERVSGFEESFRTPDEDQAFYAKLCLSEAIYVSDDCLDWYRQHPTSVTAVARQQGTVFETREQFLIWLKSYLIEHQITNDEVWMALRRETWRISSPSWLLQSYRAQRWVRWIRKWLLKFEARLIPTSIRIKLWAHR
jgi:glycosyltransferase involved in cell wall biosynthesis